MALYLIATLSNLTLSDFLIENNFLILVALLGPNLRALLTSVTPGISYSPFLTI